MITADLETKITAAIATKLSAVSPALPTYQIIGSWAVTSTGVPVDDPSTVAVIAVSLGTPTSQTYTAPDVSFQGSVALAVRRDRDTTHSAFVAFADALVDLFKTWQSETYQSAFTALDLTNLSIDEVTVQGGSYPATTDAITSITLPFVLKGSYRS